MSPEQGETARHRGRVVRCFDASNNEISEMSDPKTSGTDKLAATIANVMAAIDSVPKNGTNDYHGYDYSTDDDVMQSVRPVMAQHNLIALPSVTDREITKVETNSGTALHTRVTLEITLIDGDSGQSKTVTWEGEAQDGQDKGLYKAYTSGVKYWALKTFLLSADTDVETHDAAASYGSPQSEASGSTQEPSDSQLEYARDLAKDEVWTDAERNSLLNDRIPAASKNELSDLIEHMKKVTENGREVLNGK